MSITEEQVKLAYQMILGREPENTAVVADKVKNIDTVYELGKEMLLSDEFTAAACVAQLEKYYFKQPLTVDVVVDDGVLELMFTRISQEWKKLGENDPYWSVLTSDDYKLDRISQNIEPFYATGKRDAGLVELFCGRAGLAVPSGVCLELGCGVGRVTQYLSKKFDKVIAIDISPANIEICKCRLDKQNISNVETILISSPNEFELIEKYDFIFSTIVLQHNPPPIQYYILDQLLGGLSEYGVFLFQTATNIPGYSFSADRYLDMEEMVMEMHSLPMKYLFELFDKHYVLMKEVIQDNWTGLYGSHTFFGVKKPINS